MKLHRLVASTYNNKHLETGQVSPVENTPSMCLLSTPFQIYLWLVTFSITLDFFFVIMSQPSVFMEGINTVLTMLSGYLATLKTHK